MRMMVEVLPFQFGFDAIMIASVGLWSLALYLGFSPIGEWITEKIIRWFNFAERSFYFSVEEFEKTRVARENQNAFYASLFSIVPFLVVGWLCNYGVNISLGRSWAISLGILFCMTGAVYELARRHSQS